jgi:hypothetical protein
MRQPRCEVGVLFCSKCPYCTDLEGRERRSVGSQAILLLPVAVLTSSQDMQL